jgi:hypothetical protein
MTSPEVHQILSVTYVGKTICLSIVIWNSESVKKICLSVANVGSKFIFYCNMCGLLKILNH